MEEPRKHIFEAAREACGRGLTQAEVELGDGWMDKLGLSRDGELFTAGELHTSAKGRALIQSREGCKLKAYPDPGTGGAPWTIGWGATGADVHPGLVWTQAQADARFEHDLAAVEAGVRQLLAGHPCTQGQFDALVSFAYNVGLDIDADEIAEGLGDSSLLKLHLAGNYAGAALEFGKWVNGGGRKLPGLVERRAAEAALYRGDA